MLVFAQLLAAANENVPPEELIDHEIQRQLARITILNHRESGTRGFSEKEGVIILHQSRGSKGFEADRRQSRANIGGAKRFLFAAINSCAR
jgi:hypothetical protein